MAAEHGGHSDLATQMRMLREENEKLMATLNRLQGGIGSSQQAAPATPAAIPATFGSTNANAAFMGMPPAPPAPKRSYGELKLWTGTWNMGARDPFSEMDVAGNPDTCARMLAPFLPQGYDVYVLGLQEGVSDAIYEAVEQYTNCFRLPLNARLFTARDSTGSRVRSRRVGRAIEVQSFIEEARLGVAPEPVTSTADMLDRVWGRGDGAMLTPKFTGIAVFVAPVVAPYIRLLGMYKHSFGASEGSKGGVGVALGLYDVTVAFINTHMASKRSDMRRAQYCELVDRLGGKLGGRGFGLNESFHHVIWMGDLNVHCKGVSAADAVALIRTGRHMQLLMQHDELLIEKDEETSFFEYEEPLMGPRFFPTYKKMPGRGRVDTRDPDWVSKVYVTAYKEPFYKGGRVMERVPAWTDRIQYHSLPDRWGELLPEPLDPKRPDSSIHNYHAVHDSECEGLDTSDHSPVYATFSLQICAEEVDEGLAAYVEQQQAMMGYGQAESGKPLGGDENDALNGSMDEGAMVAQQQQQQQQRNIAIQLPPVGPVEDTDFSSLHPSLRPLQVDLTLYGIVVDYKGNMVVPRAVSCVFPLPYEDSNEIPDRRKVARESSSFPFFGRQTESLALSMRTVVSRSNRLEALHLLIKVSLDDNTKAQAVIAMKDGGFIGPGAHMNTFLQPLTSNGVPCKVGGKPVMLQFTMEMNAFERGGVQMAIPPPVPVTSTKPASSMGLVSEKKRTAATPGPAPVPVQQPQYTPASSSSSSGGAVARAMADAEEQQYAAIAAVGRGAAAQAAPTQQAAAATPARPPMAQTRQPAAALPMTSSAGSAAPSPAATRTAPAAAGTPASQPVASNEVAKQRAMQMMQAARAKAALAMKANGATPKPTPGAVGTVKAHATVSGMAPMAGDDDALNHSAIVVEE